MQSQATSICQDNYHHLWIATIGGISSFDGKEFRNYTESDGLLHNFVNCIYADTANRIWAGTPFGLSCFDGRKFKNYVFSKKPRDNAVHQVTADSKGNIWALVNFKLFKFENNDFKPVHVGEGSPNLVTAIARDRNGSVWASVFKKGLFLFHNDKWGMAVDYNKCHLHYNFTGICFDVKDKFKFWLEYPKGLFLLDHNQITDSIRDPASRANFQCISINEDKFSNLWFGTNRGVYRYANHRLELFNAQNGFTDNTVNDIFSDNESNLWFGTNSDGIFRYSFDPFLFIDQTQGLKSPVIMTISKDRNDRIWLGTYGDGLYWYDQSKPINRRITFSGMKAQRINRLFSDRDGNTWIGTDNEGIWKYQHGKPARIDNPANRIPPTATCIAQDASGAIWISTPLGCLRLRGHQVNRYLDKMFTTSVFCFAKDSVFIGTLMGLYLWTGDSVLRKIDLPSVDSTYVLCMEKRGTHLLIGTGQRGIIDWNIPQHAIKSISSTNGLNGDVIYSMALDSADRLWVGTGSGIDQVRFNRPGENPYVVNYSEYGTISAAECNQNAVMSEGSNVWFGTTKGAIIVNTSLPDNPPAHTHIVLQSVLLFGKELVSSRYNDSLSSWYNIPFRLKLSHDRNNLSFTFRGVGFRNANQVFYEYKMDGFDNSYSNLTTSPVIIYPSLLPGKYRLLVRSYTRSDGFSDNTIVFPFEITEAFYDSAWFRILIIIFFIAMALTVQAYRTRMAEKRKWQIEQLKREEQIKIRQRTSEDFHDELGNKLTRISVLSDILQTQTLSPESTKIIGQIKENITALYTGTRDILWALQPGSDQLIEIVKRLGGFGMELFKDTNIVFRFEDSVADLQTISLPSDINRNIIMIFKEAMNNSLKYAGCRYVDLQVFTDEKNRLVIQLRDDGKGFDRQAGGIGQGIGNMYQRAGRIGADITIESRKNEGTHIRLTVKLTPKRG